MKLRHMLSAAALLFAVALCQPAQAQNWTTVVAHNLVDYGGHKVGSALLCFRGTDGSNNPQSFQVGGGGQTITTMICTTVVNGAIGVFQVPNPAQTNPQNINYEIFVLPRPQRPGVTPLLHYTGVLFNGATFNFDNYAPPDGTNIAPLNTVVGPFTVSGNESITGDLTVGGLATLALLYYDIADRPSAAAVATGLIVVVTDAAESGNCTTGGGSGLALCRSNGTSWESLGGGATSIAWSDVTTGTNATTLHVGSGGTLDTTGTGIINATKINGVSVTGTPAAGYVPTATSSSSATWQTPAIVGLTSPPTSGLMARYEIAAGESAGAIVDTSGNGRDATGTVGGTAPTVGSTGGLICSAGTNGAITLPSALNSALTIAMFATELPNIGGVGFWAPVIGNGNGTTTNSIGILFNNTGGFGGANVDNVVTFTNSAYKSKAYQGFFGTGSVVVTLDATDHIFINNIDSTYYATATSAGSQGAGFYQLCGAAAGYGTSVASYASNNVTLWKVYFYDHVLTATERAQLQSYWQLVMPAAGHPQTLISSFSGSPMFINGDSISAGLGVTTNPFTAATFNSTYPYTLVNRGFPAAEILKTITNQDYTSGIHFLPGVRDNLQILWMATNDCYNGRTAAQIWDDNANQVRYWKRLGGRTLLVTMISRVTFDTCKNEVNALFRNNWRAIGADGLIDMAASTEIGADSSYSNTTYFALDQVHPNQNGVFNVITPILQRGINRANGNVDWSSATHYTSAAPAATATTAGSESGNTITITFGTTPANCQVGNRIHITGATPSDYNGDWLIRTRSSTQVTYYTATTSIGNITVQGTGECSQQQDLDVYQVLDFGTGNYTIKSAVGYTGQNLWFKNINAADSTIVPDGSETIDTASSLTITTGSVVCLTSVLVSAAAAGANWVTCK